MNHFCMKDPSLFNETTIEDIDGKESAETLFFCDSV